MNDVIFPDGPPLWPVADANLHAAVAVALADGSWGQYDAGQVSRLQDRLRAFHNVDHVLTCGSGSFALEAALRALQIGAGHEVLIAGYDYPGNFLAIHAVGALPVLVDLDPDNWNLSVEKLAEGLGPQVRAIVVSHLHGGLVPMRELMRWARQHHLSVIEDACQATGATVQGRRAGTWGDIGVLSFGGSKLLSAGRGGALLTNSAQLHQRLRLLLTRAGNWLCPLSELQAIVLLPQLDQLDERNRLRSERVQLLQRKLQAVPGLRLLVNRAEGEPSYYKLGFQYEAEAFGLPRTRFVQALRAEGIALDEGFPAFHVGRSPTRYRSAGSLEQVNRAHHGSLVLHHPVLLTDAATIERVASAVRSIASGGGRKSIK